MAPTSAVLMMMSGRRINCFCLSMSVLLSVNLSLVTITCSDHRGVYKTFLSLQIAIPFYILKNTLFCFATSESQFFSLVKYFSLNDSSDYFAVQLKGQYSKFGCFILFTSVPENILVLLGN